MKKEMDRLDLFFSTLIMAVAMIMMIGAVGYSADMFTLDFLTLPSVSQSLEERGLMPGGNLSPGTQATSDDELPQQVVPAGSSDMSKPGDTAPQQELAPDLPAARRSG